MPLKQLGRYKIIETLGRGAMGVVYKAYDPLIDRTVAIKTVDHTTLSREEAEDFEQRFKREAKSAGRLNHPNIVTIHDVGRSDDLSYIAMEFLVGRSLRQLLDSGYELSLLRIADIAAQISDGLAFAHAHDVVHRDIKPANIMILDNDVVKITDFGVALLPSGANTLDGAACGSPKYMSPEQITGQKADGRSDIFSLGAVLYEMLAGCPAFSGDDLRSILYQVLNNAPPLPSSFYPSLPSGFDRIVARAMAKSPEKRYQSAGELSADLRKYRRYAKQSHKRERSEGAATGEASDSAQPAEHLGDATLPAGTPSLSALEKLKSGLRTPALRVVLPLALVVVLAAAMLLRPDASLVPPPVIEPAAVPADVPATEPAAELVVAPSSPLQPVAEGDAQTAAQISATPPSEPVEAPTEASPAQTPEPALPIEPATPVPAVVEVRVQLAIAPWGEVRVDNRKVGISPPLTEIRLKPGKHTIEIRNGSFPPYLQNVNLAPKASLRIKHKFE